METIFNNLEKSASQLKPIPAINPATLSFQTVRNVEMAIWMKDKNAMVAMIAITVWRLCVETTEWILERSVMEETELTEMDVALIASIKQSAVMELKNLEKFVMMETLKMEMNATPLVIQSDLIGAETDSSTMAKNAMMATLRMEMVAAINVQVKDCRLEW